MTTTSFSAESSEAILWSRDDISGDATFAFTNLYQSGAPQEAVKVTADAAFGALATWLSEQQRLVERAFEVRLHCCDRWLATLASQPRIRSCRTAKRPSAHATYLHHASQMERYTLTQRFTEERMLALTEQRTILLAEAAEDKAAALAEQRTVLEAAAAEDKAAALKELKLLLESVAAEDKARALAALKAQLEAAAAKAQAEALAALKAQLEAEFERQLAALRVRAPARKL